MRRVQLRARVPAAALRYVVGPSRAERDCLAIAAYRSVRDPRLFSAEVIDHGRGFAFCDMPSWILSKFS
jgi:hypothetical protein